MVDTQQLKPYVMARKAAELLGITTEEVVADIKANKIANLHGGEMVDLGWFVPSWELTGERLEMHRDRLTAIKSVVQP
jgi:hypothetical protein